MVFKKKKVKLIYRTRIQQFPPSQREATKTVLIIFDRSNSESERKSNSESERKSKSKSKGKRKSHIRSSESAFCRIQYVRLSNTQDIPFGHVTVLFVMIERY